MKLLKFVVKLATLVGIGYFVVKKIRIAKVNTRTETKMSSECHTFGDGEGDYEL